MLSFILLTIKDTLKNFKNKNKGLNNQDQEQAGEINIQHNVTLDEIHRGARAMAKWLRNNQSNFTPDVILAIPGGGIIVAELLSFEFQEYINITSAFRQPTDHSTINNDDYPIKTSKYNYNMLLNGSYWPGKKVLIVDIFLNSGESMEAFKDKLKEYGVNNTDIKTAVILQTNNYRVPRREVDFFHINSQTVNVHWPWGHAIAKIRNKY